MPLVQLYRLRLFFSLLPLRYRPATATRRDVKELQRWHNRVVLLHRPLWVRRVVLLAERLVWPVWSAWLAFRMSGAKSPGVRAAIGRGRWWQWGRAFRLAQTERFAPGEFYALNLWRSSASPSDYLTEGRLRHTFRALNHGVDLSVLDDKQQFWAFCRKHGLATPPLLFTAGENQLELFAPEAELAQDLFLKRRSSMRGMGAARWVYEAKTGRHINHTSGERLDRAALLAHYRSRRKPFIAQHSLFDHPAIADIGNGTLCVIRVMTVIRPDGTIGEFASLFKAPTGRSFLTNLGDGALFSPVDSARGELRRAFMNTLGNELHDRHPITGVRVAGRPLPDWPAAVELACAAHRGLPKLALVGWDVALTAEGPLLLEGNHTMTIAVFNFPPNPPLGHTALAEILVWHLERKFGGGAGFRI